MRAGVVGIAGPELGADEAALFRELPPAGVILFGRNVIDPGQLAALTGALREVLPAEAAIAVDQEGGRVARLRAPGWREHPAAGVIGALPDEASLRAAWLSGALIGLDCAAVGIGLVCAPVLDLRVPGASDVIGDRSFGGEPSRVAALGMAFAQGVLAAGVVPVGKHAPGHGRASVDSHRELPCVPAGIDLAGDVAVFRACAGLPWMMTAHIRYDAWDSGQPGTLSPAVIRGVIRGAIGFQGVLVSDDLAMGALEGTPGALAAAAVAAGCDLALHCTGALEATRAVLETVPEVGDLTRARMWAGRLAAEAGRRVLDADALAAERAGLLQ